jgi:hypothetical protein
VDFSLAVNVENFFIDNPMPKVGTMNVRSKKKNVEAVIVQ